VQQDLMKKFTVKDFIAYNNPCFNCNNPINFTMETGTKTSDSRVLRPVVGPEYTEVNLRVNYSNSITLFIFHKTNKILSNNNQLLMEYLDEHQINLISYCAKCSTRVFSNPLKFHVDKSYVEAVGLENEYIAISHAGVLYHLNTDFSHDRTLLTIFPKPNTKSGGAQSTMDLPLLPKYRFKNKAHFIDKIKTYILFS
jgi:hypothetical protein